MPELTGFVFETALDAARKWTQAGKDWSISINVAPGTVTAPDFCQALSQLILNYGVRPERVIIEIPERAVAQEPEALCDALNAVRALGVQVSLDGGGIVPVDLTQFKPMPFTSIKVGGPASIRLAQRLGLKGKGAIAARLRYARHFNLEAVAVGAEDEATLAGLAEVGFTAAQGIWIQKPLALDELLAWDGKWAKGRVALDSRPPVPNLAIVAPVRAPEVHRSPEQHAARMPADDAAKAHAAGAPDVTKEDMQRALDAVRAKRAGNHQPTLQPKPVQRVEPMMPVLEGDDLEDIVEDEEVTTASAGPAVKRQGFGPPPESCPPMKSLVERRSG
jgi:EAL domain-containing protein (putative c-di-GMP-specific phosphodiesterase class I)